MITCDYSIVDNSGNDKIISADLMYDLLTRATNIYKASIDDVLFSRADKLNGRTKILEDIKGSGNLNFRSPNSVIDGDISYQGDNGEYSISSFVDSPLARPKVKSVYLQRNLDDYKVLEFEILTAGHKSTDPDWQLVVDDANKQIENTIKNWDKIEEDGKILHKLCVDHSIGFHERDWDAKKLEFITRALTLIKEDSPFRDIRLLESLYVTFATAYRDIKGLHVESNAVRNIGLTAKLKDIDAELFGHIDYAFIDKSGNLHLYNFKVTSLNPSKWAKAKRDKFKLEGAFIKLMLIANGVQVNNIGEINYNIVPLRVYYNEDYTKINKVIWLSPDGDYKENRYTTRPYDNVAKQFIEIPFLINTLNEKELSLSDKILEQAFPFMKVGSERVFKSTLDWISEAPSVSDTDSLVIKEVNEDNCRYRVILYDKTYDIKDFTEKKSNLEIIKLVLKHLNELNSELGDYSSKIASAVERAFKHNSHYLNDLQNSSFISGVLAKYLPIDKDHPSDWDLNTDLIEYNILLFKRKDGSEQIDIVDITSEDLQQLGDFRKGATNILGSYKLDGNKEASTLKGDMGNVELIKTMVVLNLLLPSLDSPKLGEVVILSTSKNGQSRRHYIELFNNEYFKDFLRIIKKETGGVLTDVKNNISKAEFTDFFDDVVETYNNLMEGLSEAQKNTFELMGFSELQNDKTKILGLFNILENLSKYLKNYSPEEIYDIAHPRYGKSSDPLLLTAALLYEIVSKAYLYYTNQSPKYERGLSYIDINAFTAPTIPDYNVRLVVNNMLTTLDSIAYEENLEYEKHISPIVLEYYKACGYSDIQNLTIGNQLHLFDNLYLKDNPMMMFKNPYDMSNDLKSHERIFLKKSLFYINKVKEGRYAGSKTLFKDYNDPKIAEYINNDKEGESYLWVPLTRASKATLRLQGLSSRWERIKRGLRIASKSEHWYSEIISNMTELERADMDENIKALSLRNPFDIGEDFVKRANYLAKEGQAIFETNVENIMLEYMAKAKEVEKLNKFLVGTKALLFLLLIMGNDSNEAKEVIEKESKLIKEYITLNAFNTSTMDPTNLKIVAALLGTKLSVTFLNLAGNMVSFFRDSINGFMENFLRSVTKFQTDLKAESLTKAYEYVIVNGRSNAMNVNLLSKLNIRYRLSNTDLARIKERLRTGRNGVYNWDNWAYATLRSPDFLNRMTLFVARCMLDGVWEAYSLEDGELKYDVNKDLRFLHFLKDDINHPDYKKEKALFILHVNNWNKEHPNKILDWADKILPEPYSDLEILAIKNVANNIYGSYDKSLKALYEHNALGWAFGMYTTWMNGIWNNWAMKPGQYNIHNMETRILQDENGNYLYMLDNGNIVTEYIDEQGSKTYIDDEGNVYKSSEVTPILELIPIITQGIWYTLCDAFLVLRDPKNGGFIAAYKYIQSNEIDKRNWRHMLATLMTALLFMLLFKYALTPAYNESKKKSSGLSTGAKLLASLSYRSLNGARDTFAGPLNIIEYFGEQMDPPMYRVPVKLIKDAGNTIFGDKTFALLLTGNIAIARNFRDIVPRN